MSRLGIEERLEILADAAKYDASCASSGTSKRHSRDGKSLGSTQGAGICHAYAPDGRCISLLKLLLTNHCIFDCHYCVNRKSSNVRRARFTPQEVVDLTLSFYRRNYIEGLFLSSGIVKSSSHTMEQMIEVARSLREDHGFRGYIHLKTIPEADPELIKRAGLWADRVSINVELPTNAGLAKLAPDKCLKQIEGAIADIGNAIIEAKEARKRFRHAPQFAPAGQSTQMIVGADGASDSQIIGRASSLYDRFKLRRVYYSAFSPIPDASAVLPLKRPPLMREHRLYQSDWLVRFYGFAANEVQQATDTNGMLPLDIDPKLAWALGQREHFPVDINRAPREILLRVPGLGTRAVAAILQARRHHRLRLDDVGRLTRSISRIRPFIVAADWRPTLLMDRLDLHSRLTPPPPDGIVRVRIAPTQPTDLHCIVIRRPDDFQAWREQARTMAAAGIPPERIIWSADEQGERDLFGTSRRDLAPIPSSQRSVRANKAFLRLAGSVILHNEPVRFALLYRLLWRLQDDPHLMEKAADSDVYRLTIMAGHVRKDIHKMRAFVRFRAILEPDGNERYVAWFEPEHHILRANANFFVNRFASQRWSILTPDLCLHWDGGTLAETPGADRQDTPDEDAVEGLWQRYYASIFNPARLKVTMMVKEMPRRYWKNLPEARLIPGLIAGAQVREAAMVVQGRDPFPESLPASLDEIAEGIAACHRCSIGCNGTRAVAGEGPARAQLLIVGEQPGDCEEQVGRPFVGPAGQLLNDHLKRVGLDRSQIRITNAVKHFKFEQHGKQRIHQNPTAGEIDRCRWWLDAERRLVKPDIILALGSSAGRALLGRSPRITNERGKLSLLPDGSRMWLTVHPSFLLRLDGEMRIREEDRFQHDLVQLRAALKNLLVFAYPP